MQQNASAAALDPLAGFKETEGGEEKERER